MGIIRQTIGTLITAFGIVVLGASLCQGNEMVEGDWLGRVEKQIADSEYAVSWQSEAALPGFDVAYHAPNRAQGFRTYFTPEGIRVIPRSAEMPAWEWRLTLSALGRRGAMTNVSGADLRVDGNRIEYTRDEILEWYVNDAKGLEQGFTIVARPTPLRSKEVVLELTLEGTLSAFPSADGKAIDFKTPQGAYAVHYAGLRVTDANDRELPARMEAFAEAGRRGIRLVFDDTGASYPVTIDPLATSPAWTAESDQVNAYLGFSVATAGDVNGDGYSDIIVGAYLYSNGTFGEGRAFVYLGSASGPATTASWTAESNNLSAGFGVSVATAGDVNGDGYADVIVGAYQYSNGQNGEGRVYVYLGSASGLAAEAAWTAESNQVGAYFGWSVATAGDVNGDGYSDVIIGRFTNGPFSFGRACVYLGSASGLGATEAWAVESPQLGSKFGYSVATAGDVNGDGYADVIVGAYGFSNGQSGEGRAYVYLGSSAGLGTTAAWTAEINQAGAQLGYSVGTAGDVNGDGYADVIVGANLFSSGQGNQGGGAFLYLGSAVGPAAFPVWNALGDQAGSHVGVSVATAGDVNGDGYADVVVGADLFGNGEASEGRVYLYLGSSGGLFGGAVWTAEGNQEGAQFGHAVATGGDVNGDGYSDVIVGADRYSNGQSNEGRAFLYLGSSFGLGPNWLWMAESDQGAAEFGASVAAAGDVNGDGYSDIIVGARWYDNGETNEGRTYVYLGSSSGLGTSAAWIAESNQTGAHFGSSVATAGDVNGDGYSDVIVGAAHQTVPAGNGQAFVYLGSASGLAANAAWLVDSGQAGASFGASVATAGDVNGDGYSDIIVGAPDYDNGQTDEGRAYVYLGSASGLETTALWTAESDQAGASFGSPVGTAGDVNGDGYSDVIVGASSYSTDQSHTGRVYVYLGSPFGLGTSALWTAEGHTLEARFGIAAATAGDVNGDGYSDVVVGQASPERSLVYHGSASGLAASAASTVGISQPNAAFGSSVATAGDVNGDGYSDVIVGAPAFQGGSAYVYLGSASGLASQAWSVESNEAGTTSFGISVGTAGDINGDGYSDVIVGGYHFGESGAGRVFAFYGGVNGGLDRIPRQTRTDGTTPIALLGKSPSETELRLGARGRTPAGRGDVRLQWEVKPLGTPFNGAGMGSSPFSDTGAPGALGSATSFNVPVTGLAEGTFYHWRVRMVSTDPYFPRSPWMSLAGNNVTETKLRTSGCVDRDGDGYGEFGDPSCLSLAPDCNNANPALWGTPSETRNLRFTSKTTLLWDVPASPGTFASALVYDTLRSGAASNFLVADCVETNNGSNTTATDIANPSLGEVFYYLTRAENACPAGYGAVGTTSSGAPRVVRGCP